MTQLQIFSSPEFGEIRTVETNGMPYFVGKDVADILGYVNASKALLDHVDEEDKLNNETLSSLGQRGGWLINESGLYSLILSSKLPVAKLFKRWVTAEVLPSLRKTGGYVGDEDTFIATYLPYADQQTRLLFKTTLGAVQSLNRKIEQDKPKVLFADALAASESTILVGELAKLLKGNGVSIGQNRLFAWLRDCGYLIKRHGQDYNDPTQRAMELGLFKVKKTAIAHASGHTTINKTIKVTPKGQQYFINKFLGT